MLAAFSFVIVMAHGVGAEPPPKAPGPHVAVALDQAMDDARRDFDRRYAELGLLGSAPLPGMAPDECSQASQSPRWRADSIAPLPDAALRPEPGIR